MKKILEFSKFKGDYRPLTLLIKGQAPIAFTQEQAQRKELLVKNIIREIYGRFAGDTSFEFEGYIISGELLTKAQKNIAILYDMIQIAKSQDIIIKTPDELIDFIELHGQDLFHPEGEFFNIIYSKLGGTTQMGRDIESDANEFFTNYARRKGVEIELKAPENYREDIAGVDAYFTHNNKRYTIQTKKLSNVTESGDFYCVYISGDFTPIKTHYLVLIPSVTNNIGIKYIFKGANVKSLKDSNNLDYYQIPKVDLIHSE